MTKIAVTLDAEALRGVDRLKARGRFANRSDAIAAVIRASVRRGGRELSVEEVLAIAKRGRAEYRAGKARVIGSSAELR